MGSPLLIKASCWGLACLRRLPTDACLHRASFGPACGSGRRSHSTHETIDTSVTSVDCVVIGAGVIGLACARTLALAGLEVVVVEQEDAYGTATSARSSEVIHAGIYYPPGSLMASLCVQGKGLLYNYCQQHNIPHRRLGKLIVATSQQQVDQLHVLQARGRANGVDDLTLMSAQEACHMEPALQCAAALLSPSTGIIDSHVYMTCLLHDLETAGGMLALGTRVVGCQTDAPGMGTGRAGGTGGKGRFTVMLREGGGKRGGARGCEGGETAVEARYVVNSAGLHAQEVAAGIQGMPAGLVPQRRLAKGSYFSLAVARSAGGAGTLSVGGRDGGEGGSGAEGHSGEAESGCELDALSGVTATRPFRRLVYPVPEPGGLGIHYTLDMAGQARFGPDVEWIKDIDYNVDPMRGEAFYASVRRYFPGLRDGALQPSYCGIRPKITAPGQPDADFLIQGSGLHGVPGLVNLFGMGSPGLTASLAIAEFVKQQLLTYG